MSNKINLSIFDTNFIDIKNEENYLPIFNEECLKTINTYSAYLLNKKNNFNKIEKFIYELTQFHMNKMNLDINSDNINIEFWFKTSETYKKQLHTDGDDNSINSRKISPCPIFTSLLYLNDHSNPTFITNINEESYKYKNFENENSNLFFIFPKKLRNVIFDPSYFHSEIDIFNENDIKRNVLVINVWKNYKPINIPFYNNINKEYILENTDEILINFKKYNYINNIEIDYEKTLNEDFFTEILYRNNNIYFKKFKELIDYKQPKNDVIMFYNSKNINEIKKEHPLKLIKFNCNIIDFENINILSNFINENDLNFFNNIPINYGILNKNCEIFNYIKENLFLKLYNSIVELYKLNDQYNINICDVKISKNITYDRNYTCIASLFLYEDVISDNNNSLSEEINIKSKSIIFKNNTFTNNVKNQLLIEFFINIW